MPSSDGICRRSGHAHGRHDEFGNVGRRGPPGACVRGCRALGHIVHGDQPGSLDDDRRSRKRRADADLQHRDRGRISPQPNGQRAGCVGTRAEHGRPLSSRPGQPGTWTHRAQIRGDLGQARAPDARLRGRGQGVPRGVSWRSETRPSRALLQPDFSAVAVAPAPPAFENIAVDISAVGPYMCRIAGELCDGCTSIRCTRCTTSTTACCRRSRKARP